MNGSLFAIVAGVTVAIGFSAIAITSLAAPIAQSGTASSAAVKVTWIHSPTSRQVGNFVSHCEDRLPVSGEATLVCRLTASRRISNCVVKTEEPKACGFGRAALQMAPFFQASRRTIDGRRVKPGMKVNIPFRFKMAD
jgi:hypothetical protein